MIKQADVELLTFPLEYPLSAETIATNLDTYRRATDPDGPAMGRAISAVVAAQLGRREQAYELFLAAYTPHLWGPYYALAETPTNGAVNFLTGIGGALQSLLFGFAGLRIHPGALAVDPLLPSGWKGLRFPAISWRGRTISIAILPGDRCEVGFTAAGTGCILTLSRWRDGSGPLAVALQTAQPCTCSLYAGGWLVEPQTGGLLWRLFPPAGSSEAFVTLVFTIRSEYGEEIVMMQQRVRSGDD